MHRPSALGLHEPDSPPVWWRSIGCDRSTPCHQGVSSAATIKAAGTLVYSIAYDLSALNGGANECRAQSYQGPL